MTKSGSEIATLRIRRCLREEGMSDRLTDIVMEMLGQSHDPAETAAALIRRAAGAYAIELLKLGQIPYNFVDDVLTDLEHEALEIYRKKTYGHISLESYRKAKAPKKTHS